LAGAAGWKPSASAEAVPLVAGRSTGLAAPNGDDFEAGAVEGVEGLSSRRAPLPKMLGRPLDAGGVSDFSGGADPGPSRDAGGR